MSSTIISMVPNMTGNTILADGATLFPKDLLDVAARTLKMARDKGVRLATAETVTSGLVGACLTSVSGASEVFERGYVLYHSSAKATGLGVDPRVSAEYGAVSAEVTRGLATGLLSSSEAFATVAVTGYAGPGGGSEKNPVGTIYIAAANRDGNLSEQRHVFPGNRDNVRLEAVRAAMLLLGDLLVK